MAEEAKLRAERIEPKSRDVEELPSVGLYVVNGKQH
jgi:hypothetical protein